MAIRATSNKISQYTATHRSLLIPADSEHASNKMTICRVSIVFHFPRHESLSLARQYDRGRPSRRTRSLLPFPARFLTFPRTLPTNSRSRAATRRIGKCHRDI